ncbi:MAG: TatD family hydrolase [Desulfobulbaceae bacterium]|jgi:TatD DNase family protein|nr:TatD family hydrolase [Desulfobulbaceae bacterium]
MLIDSHCHLDMDDYTDDLDAILARAKAAGVSQIITVGIDLDSSRQALALARKYSMLKAAVGIHPHDSVHASDSDWDGLLNLVAEGGDAIVAWGEIGLDYAKDYSPRPIQRRQFARQLELAAEARLPVIIHDREAHSDILAALLANPVRQHGGVLHCFSGDWLLAKKVVDLGLYVSLSGVVTFKNAAALQEVAVKVPLDRLLVETDGPFLAPHPYRGKRNEPAWLVKTAEHIARLRGISLAELAAATTANTRRLFAIEHEKDK